MKRIEFGELRIGPIARMHLDEVCESNWASMGPKVKAFEMAWNNLFNYCDSVAVSSGTDAVLNACLSLYDFGAKRGDEIIVPALGFIATSNAVRLAGFVPVFVDVNISDMNIDCSQIIKNITNKTIAIIAVHTMGQMCDMLNIVNIAADYGLMVIEDSAEAHGAKIFNTTTGNFGAMACFSFYIAHLVCCGEGGMVSCPTHKLGNIIRSTRSHGRNNADLYFDHVRVGLNSKMNDMEASLGLEGLSNFWETFFIRSYTMRTLLDNLPDGSAHLANFVKNSYATNKHEYGLMETVNCPHGFSIVAERYGNTPLFYIEELQDKLDENNISWKRNFGCIPTQHRAFADMGYTLGDFPNAEWIGDHGIHIGCHQYLTKDDINRISNVLNNFFIERIHS